MGTVTLEQVGGEELALPLRIQVALGELVDSAKQGLLAPSVGVGLGEHAELLEEEVVEIVGPKGKHIPERTAVGHGHELGEVTLGGRRVAVDRPRGAPCRRPLRGAASEVRVRRRPGSAVARGAGADAGWRRHPSLPQDAGASRPGGGAAGAVDVALVGLADLH